MKKLSEIATEDKPFERFMRLGAGRLTDRELIANIIRSGTPGTDVMEIAESIVNLADQGGGLGSFYHLSPEDLKAIPGVGKVKACQILCMAELSRRIVKSAAPRRPDMSSPEKIAEFFMEELRHLEQEELRLVMLNARCDYLNDLVLFRGTVNASVISPREIFRTALRYQAVSIVLLHNHPSGDPTPSPEDIDVTRKIQEAGRALDVPLLDHLIIGNLVYTSLKERGIIHG